MFSKDTRISATHNLASDVQQILRSRREEESSGTGWTDGDATIGRAPLGAGTDRGGERRGVHPSSK